MFNVFILNCKHMHAQIKLFTENTHNLEVRASSMDGDFVFLFLLQSNTNDFF